MKTAIFTSEVQTGLASHISKAQGQFGAFGVLGMLVASVCLLSPVSYASAAVACDPAVELATNGSFENPVVTTAVLWDIFSSGDPQLGWSANWLTTTTTYNGVNRPATAQIELQRAVHDGWGIPFDGQQYAELDTDWAGPIPPSLSYPASIDLYQDIQTIPGATYSLSFAFSPRPDDADLSDNSAVVSWNGAVIDTVTATSVNPASTTWSTHSYTVVATASTTRIDFADAGNPNAIGTFIDDVSLRCNSLGGGGGGGFVQATSTLTVINTVVNANGGTATPSDFIITVNGSGVSTTTATSTVSTLSLPGSSAGVTLTLEPGTYTVTSLGFGAYATSLSADCTGSLIAGSSKTCTITNTDPANVGGGGGNGPIVGSLGGGGNGPIVGSLGGGMTPPVGGTGGTITPPAAQGIVLGASTTTVPQFPNTGEGGDASRNYALLAGSLAVALGSFGAIKFRSNSV